jgi:hypothetical protein
LINSLNIIDSSALALNPKRGAVPLIPPCQFVEPLRGSIQEYESSELLLVESLRDSSCILKIILLVDFITILNTKGVPPLIAREHYKTIITAERFHQD